MVQIEKIENDSIVYYNCSCGVKGKCIVRPLSDSVVNQLVYIECPSCRSGISCLLAQEARSENTMCVEEDIEYQCGIVIKNEILKG